MTVPDVSVVIPVFNAVEYVGEAIHSVLDQEIAPERVELIVVDDGSTDGSDGVLSRIAVQEPRMTVLTQENSGTPGGARNPALDIARGTFVFFLDSDDLLTPGALESMVDVAIAENSDVVLGKLASSDHRRVPSSMFQQTVLDADLLGDRIFNTLGPTKLIRREIIERLSLRFPTDQTVGEDEPFMASVYLNARKISVLADRDYYIVRYREDGGNMTLRKRDSASHSTVALRVAQVIETFTDPGEFRDGLLRRPLDRPLARALDARWAKMDPVEQSELAGEIRAGIGHLYTDGARQLLRNETQVKLDLLMADDLEGLTSYASFLAQGAPQQVEWIDGDFRQKLPEAIERLVPLALRAVPAPAMTCRLEALSVTGAVVEVGASVRIPLLEGAPEEIVVRARARGTEDFTDFTTTYDDRTPGTAPFFVSSEAASLPRGVWDLSVIVRFGESEFERRLGADRSRAIEPEGVSNVDEDPAPQDRVLAYFTQGRGNLSIDCGSVLHKQFALARVGGLTLDENGHAILLVQTTREPRTTDDYFCYVEGIVQHGGRRLLPSTQLGERMIGLRLPVTAEMIGASLTVAAVLGGVKTPLPVTGTEHWPSRAAGFGLVPGENGAVSVIAAADAPPSRRISPLPHGWRHPLGDVTASQRIRSSRAAEAVRRTPVVGSTARSMMRKVRRWRS